MEVLREISNLSNYHPEKGLKNELYLLSKNKDVTRRDALAHFAKNDKKSSFEVVYKRLKYKLLDGILNASLTSLPKLLVNRIRVWKRHLQIKMLIKTDNRKAGIKIAIQTIVTAEKNNELEVVESLCKELMFHYTINEPNRTKYFKYKEKFDRVIQLISELTKAELLYQDLLLATKTKFPITHIPKGILELDPIAETNDTYRFNYFYYSIKSLYYRTVKDELSFIENNKTAFSFFNKKEDDLPYLTKFHFLSELVPLYIIKHKYAEAGNTINICSQLPPKGSFNWHKIMIYQCLLGFYSNKLKISLEAYKLTKSVIPKFESSLIDEKWHLINGYLAFFNKVGQIEVNKPFKLSKWLNITEGQGNTSLKSNLLIVEFLHHLVDKDHKKYFKKSELIESYISTHFKAHKFKRTRYFLRMLKSVVKGNFHPKLTQTHAEKNFKRLLESRAELDTNNLDIEYIPYEMLWGEVIEFLSKK